MYSNCEMQDLLVRMAAIEKHSAASTSDSSTDTSMLTFIALVLAAVALFGLLMLALVLWIRRSPSVDTTKGIMLEKLKQEKVS